MEEDGIPMTRLVAKRFLEKDDDADFKNQNLIPTQELML